MSDNEFDEEQELTYEEILANVTLNGECIITIPVEEEAATKTGLKNLKSKKNIQLKTEGLPVSREILQFYSSPSKEYEGCVNLHIVLEKKGTVVVKKMTLPDDTL